MDLINNCARSRGKLNRNSYCSWSHSNPTDSNQWMERIEEEVKCGWCLWVWVVMRGNWWWFIYVCVGLVSFFVYGIVLDVCLFDFDFSGDYVIELFGKWIATHRLSKCKSPHHDYRGICFLRWIMVVFSGLTIFNGAYPVRYECHESTVWVELQQVLFGTMDCKEWQE